MVEEIFSMMNECYVVKVSKKIMYEHFENHISCLKIKMERGE